MSAFRDSALRRLESLLICPGCQTVNVPGRSPAIEVSDDLRTAYCTACSRSGPVERFQATASL